MFGGGGGVSTCISFDNIIVENNLFWGAGYSYVWEQMLVHLIVSLQFSTLLCIFSQNGILYRIKIHNEIQELNQK